MTAKANLNKESILELARRLWKISEIAGLFRVAISTVYQYVTAEELQQAREEGKGRLIDLAWERAERDSRVLIHMLQYHREEVPQTKKLVAELTDQDLAEEVLKRIAAKQLLKNTHMVQQLTVEENRQLEATSEEKLSGEGTSKEPS